MKDVLLNSRKSVITGLEGCGKSSTVFEILKDVATDKEPIIFGYKTYALMKEQMNNWSNRYDIPIEDFAIVGLNKDQNAPGLPYYTNPEYPNILKKEVRFIFMSQSSIQRKGYQHIKCELDGIFGNYKKIKHIVLDEFDFTIGLIPTLDYVINVDSNLDFIKGVESKFYQWVKKNYTEQDYIDILQAKYFHDKTFTIASWLKDDSYKVTFLTSETLAVKLLKAMNFTMYNTGIDQMKECVVNIYHNDLITKEFYHVMNKNLAWNSLNTQYDLIISDNINKYFESKNRDDDKTLDITVLNHTNAKGSNQYVNNRILTILSFIPTTAIKQLVDCLNTFDNEENYTYEEIESMFYRDRLCQAIGRSLGYRGGKETDVLTHDKLWIAVENSNFPYSINSYDFSNCTSIEIVNKDELLKEVRIAKSKKIDRIKQYKKDKTDSIKIKTMDYLYDYFEYSEGSFLLKSEIKEYCKKYNLITGIKKAYIPASKIMMFFSVRDKFATINGKRVVVVENLRFKKEF